MADIISIAKLSDERATALKEAGVEVKERVDTSGLSLTEPQYGEVFAIHAEPDEAAIFLELHGLTEKCNLQEREVFAKIMMKGGEAVRSGDAGMAILEILQNTEHNPFDTDEEGEEFFRNRQRRQFLYDLLHWKIGERTGLHGWRLGIRKQIKGEDKLRIVKVERRW